MRAKHTVKLFPDHDTAYLGGAGEHKLADRPQRAFSAFVQYKKAAFHTRFGS
jgi:hypothetical protein